MDYMYAQVEQGNAVQDYPPFRPCLRLVGIDKPAFTSQAFNGTLGCRTHFIDIAWSYFYTLLVSGAMHEPSPFECAAWTRLPASLLDDWPDQLWIEIGYNRAPTATGAYYYEIFANEDQVNIAIESLRLRVGAAVTPPPLAPTGPSASRSQSFKLSAFHVGQGMCALLYGQRDGFLLDCGGGIPLKRSIYRQWLRRRHPAEAFDLSAMAQGTGLTVVQERPSYAYQGAKPAGDHLAPRLGPLASSGLGSGALRGDDRHLHACGYRSVGAEVEPRDCKGVFAGGKHGCHERSARHNLAQGAPQQPRGLRSKRGVPGGRDPLRPQWEGDLALSR
ncbi:MAG: hypothetical protein MUE59_17275 [Thiobacillaceae bacterium]|nr:hypothetical protein [Thiobacillaceae bacterium]